MTLTDWKELTRSMNEFHAPMPLGRAQRVEMSEDSANGFAGRALAQLFDPQGRESITVTAAFAEHWCAEHSDWKMEAL